MYDRLPVPVYPCALEAGDVLDFRPAEPLPSILLGKESMAEGALYRLTALTLSPVRERRALRMRIAWAVSVTSFVLPANQPAPVIHGSRTQEIQCARCGLSYTIWFDVAEANTAQFTCLVCA